LHSHISARRKNIIQNRGSRSVTVQESGTSWVRRLTRRSPSTVIYIDRITAVEVTSAAARRRKERTLTPGLPQAHSGRSVLN